MPSRDRIKEKDIVKALLGGEKGKSEWLQSCHPNSTLGCKAGGCEREPHIRPGAGPATHWLCQAKLVSIDSAAGKLYRGGLSRQQGFCVTLEE